MMVRIVEGYESDLKSALEDMVAQGYEIRFITPNGVNRWTIVGQKP